MDDDKVIITADEAASLLQDGKYVHNYANPAGGMLLGVDYDRDDAIEAFRKAKQIEIGGPGCKAIKHPLAVWGDDNHVTFFAADMAKVEAFEAARLPIAPAPTKQEEA